MNDPTLAGLLPWLVLLPLLGACACFMAQERAPIFGLLTVSLHFALAILSLYLHQAQGDVLVVLGAWETPLGIALRGDGLALLLLCFSSGLLAWIGLHSYASVPKDRVFGYWALSLCLLSGISGLFLANDLFNVYVLIELVGLSAVGLVAISPGTSVYRAAFDYLVVNIIGSLCFLFGIALIYRVYGVLDFDWLSEQADASPLTVIAAALMTAGLVLKTALVPLHFWLPAAHGAAMPTVSAMLSGLVVKCSLYLLYILWSDVFQELLSARIALAMGLGGAIAILWGGIQALLASRLKIMAAYSTVAQIGYLYLFFPLLYWLPDSRAQITHGLAMFIMAHALAKTTLFLAIGNLKQGEGHDNISNLVGVAAKYPHAVLALAVAGISLIGLPPSGGFTAKWLLLSLNASAGLWLYFLVILIGGLLASSYVFKVLSILMANKQNQTTAASPNNSPDHSMLLSFTTSVLTGTVILFGFAGQWIYNFLNSGSTL